MYLKVDNDNNSESKHEIVWLIKFFLYWLYYSQFTRYKHTGLSNINFVPFLYKHTNECLAIFLLIVTKPIFELFKTVLCFLYKKHTAFMSNLKVNQDFFLSLVSSIYTPNILEGLGASTKTNILCVKLYILC